MTTPGSELQIIDTTAELVVRREPAAVLEEAQKAAAALMRVVSAKPRKVMLGGEQYLELEDWQTVARFYGVTAKVVESKRVDYGGGVHGFEATAVALRSDGFELSSADAACLTDEEKWRGRPKYQRELQMQDGRWVEEPIDETQHPKSTWKWNDNPRRPESRRREVGIEPVPLFQLKSMAQTRACAKVLRNVLAWVVVLAGYRPTPAEELDGMASSSETPHPAGQAAPPATMPVTGTGSASAAPATAPGAQPTVQLAPGVTFVKSVGVKKGKSGERSWTRYFAVFADGRDGVTFDVTVGKALQDAQTAQTPVHPDIVKGDKGNDLKGLLPVVAPEPVHQDEPVDGPEKVLTVRKLETDHGPRWVIQTDKRQLMTDQEAHANAATQARKDQRGIVPTFEVIPAKSGVGSVNRLTAMVVETPAAGDIEEPGAEG